MNDMSPSSVKRSPIILIPFLNQKLKVLLLIPGGKLLLPVIGVNEEENSFLPMEIVISLQALTVLKIKDFLMLNGNDFVLSVSRLNSVAGEQHHASM